MPKKRSSTGANGSEAAPRRSSRVSLKPNSIYDTSTANSKQPPMKKTKTSTTKSLAVGEKLTEPITLKNDKGEDVKILELFDKKGAVIFVYPKSNTPGCTLQACGYRDIYQDIIDAGFQVFGLSMDSPAAQTSWKEKQKLPYTLLCDPKQQLIKQLGASKSSSAVQRSHYIFEAGGKIVHITPRASTKESPKEALEFIKSLK